MVTLNEFDWGTAWIEQQRSRNACDDASYWDDRARSFKKFSGQSIYVERFLEYADIRKGESVFDMGCGWGTLALPLAEMGHKISAVDFSGRMLEFLREEAVERGDTAAANDYQELYQIWKGRENAPTV